MSKETLRLRRSMRGEPFEAWLARQRAIDERQRQRPLEANKVEAELFFYENIPPQPIDSYLDDWWFFGSDKDEPLPHYNWDEGYESEIDDIVEEAELAAMELDSIRDDEEIEDDYQNRAWEAIQDEETLDDFDAYWVEKMKRKRDGIL